MVTYGTGALNILFLFWIV